MDAMETLTKADLSKHLMEHMELPKKDADQLVALAARSAVGKLKKLPAERVVPGAAPK